MAYLLRERGMIVIDYPGENETITASGYTIRIGVPQDAERVEVRVDGGPWRLCRPAIGYWWFDWSDYREGPHSVAGRVRLRDGSVYSSAPRPFRVEFGQAALSVF